VRLKLDENLGPMGTTELPPRGSTSPRWSSKVLSPVLITRCLRSAGLQLRASPLGSAPHREHRHQVGVLVERVVDVRPGLREQHAADGEAIEHDVLRADVRGFAQKRPGTGELTGEEVTRVAILPTTCRIRRLAAPPPA